VKEMTYLTILSILAGAAILTVTANKVFKLEDDNELEELVEEIIEKKTGMDVDLTPGSKE
jgi:hypothetical protein